MTFRFCFVLRACCLIFFFRLIQVESPEGNAYDHGNARDKEHQQQIGLPEPHLNEPVAAVIDAVPAARDESSKESPNRMKQRRNIPAPRNKPLPIDREDPNGQEVLLDSCDQSIDRLLDLIDLIDLIDWLITLCSIMPSFLQGETRDWQPQKRGTTTAKT